ncbi:MAG TPA: hypothetical protein HPP77_05055 [Candidatus Hydrogenedentes bacterium]|nr:hypothetical protein [Candidatus Hydrogenedentota bacterium]
MDITTFDTYAALVEATVALLAEHFCQRADGPHAVMLSGGNTPVPAYAALAQQGPRASDTAYALFSDERMALPDSPDSNYGSAAAMLAALGVPDTRVMRVDTGIPLEAAAQRYDAELARFLDSGGRITLGLLGLGVDGHTASLFSLEDVRRGQDAWAVGVARRAGLDRVSVTPKLLRNVDRLVFLVAGKEKRTVVARLTKTPRDVPAGLAVAGADAVAVWVAP